MSIENCEKCHGKQKADFCVTVTDRAWSKFLNLPMHWTNQSAEDGADAADDEHFQHEELLLVVLLGRGLAFPTCSFVQTKKVL